MIRKIHIEKFMQVPGGLKREIMVYRNNDKISDVDKEKTK